MRSQGIRGQAAMKAALALALAASIFSPAPGNRRVEAVPNAPDERLLPRRPKPLPRHDLERVAAAEGKRARRRNRNVMLELGGGFVATRNWLNALHARNPELGLQ